MFLTRLYRYVMETYPYLDNGTYDIVERVMRPLALRQTRRPRSDHSKARRSVSSSSSHHQGTSSHQHDDDDDDVETSRASTPSPIFFKCLQFELPEDVVNKTLQIILTAIFKTSLFGSLQSTILQNVSANKLQ
ncbi:hypothetical protein Tco_0606388 [Tanacetum coccineum]